MAKKVVAYKVIRDPKQMQVIAQPQNEPEPEFEELDCQCPEDAPWEDDPEPNIPLPPEHLGCVQPGVNMPVTDIASQIAATLQRAIESDDCEQTQFHAIVKTPIGEKPTNITVQASRPRLVMVQDVRIFYERQS